MCTLYALKTTRAHIADIFGATAATTDPVAEDVYPKRLAPVIVNADNRQVQDMRWGFPPPVNGKAPVVNVRNLTSPFWAAALGNPQRRCLVPASRFCEWEGEAGFKRKRWFDVPQQPLFAFAGLWRPTEAGPAFAFLTCAPNPLVAAIHPKAMPVILHPEDHALWLGGDRSEASALAAPYPSQLMRLEPF